MSQYRAAVVAAVLAFAAAAGAQQKTPIRQASAAGTSTADYDDRVVAYIYGTEAITRRQLGEYLIKRYGADRLPTLVKRMVIEREAAARGVTVTPQEVDARLQQFVSGLQLKSPGDLKKLLKARYGMTVYEWKNDVVRVEMLMRKLTRAQVTVTEDEVKLYYEYLYGEKVEAQVILWPTGQDRIALRIDRELREDPNAFDRYASEQPTLSLAREKGVIRMPRHTMRFTNNARQDAIEREVFRMADGEISRLISTPEGIIVIKRHRLLPADATKDYAKLHDELSEGVMNIKIQKTLPQVFKKMFEKAKPKFYLGRSEDETADDLKKAALEEIKRQKPAGGR